MAGLNEALKMFTISISVGLLIFNDFACRIPYMVHNNLEIFSDYPQNVKQFKAIARTSKGGRNSLSGGASLKGKNLLPGRASNKEKNFLPRGIP